MQEMKPPTGLDSALAARLEVLLGMCLKQQSPQPQGQEAAEGATDEADV